jgi:hypothetical protein
MSSSDREDLITAYGVDLVMRALKRFEREGVGRSEEAEQPQQQPIREKEKEEASE